MLCALCACAVDPSECIITVIRRALRIKKKIKILVLLVKKKLALHKQSINRGDDLKKNNNNK